MIQRVSFLLILAHSLYFTLGCICPSPQTFTNFDCIPGTDCFSIDYDYIPDTVDLNIVLGDIPDTDGSSIDDDYTQDTDDLNMVLGYIKADPADLDGFDFKSWPSCPDEYRSLEYADQLKWPDFSLFSNANVLYAFTLGMFHDCVFDSCCNIGIYSAFGQLRDYLTNLAGMDSSPYRVDSKVYLFDSQFNESTGTVEDLSFPKPFALALRRFLWTSIDAMEWGSVLVAVLFGLQYNCLDLNIEIGVYDLEQRGYMRNASFLIRALCQQSPFELIQIMLRAGAHARCREGEPQPMFVAACMGNIQVVQLLHRGFNVPVFMFTETYSTPMHLAAQCGHMDVVQFIIETGQVFINHPDESHATILTFMARGDQHQCLPRAFELGLRPKVQEVAKIFGSMDVSAEFKSAMYEGVFRSNSDNMDYIVRLMRAAINEQRIRGLKWLLCTGIPSTAVLARDENAVKYAITQNCLESLDCLVQNMPQCLAEDCGDGRVPLLVAIEQCNLAAVNVLLAYPCPEKVLSSGLQAAICQGNLALFSAVFKHTRNFSPALALDPLPSGRNVVTEAAAMKQMTILSVLLKAFRVNPWLRDGFGCSVFDYTNVVSEDILEHIAKLDSSACPFKAIDWI